MSLLTASEYPAIRAAIDVSLDATLLPDSVIALPIYAGAADTDVQSRDPLWASRTGTALQRLVNAAIYLAAASLCPAIPQIIQEQTTEHTYQRRSVDWTALAGELRGRAEAELAAVIESDAQIERPTMFTVGIGRRGR